MLTRGAAAILMTGRYNGNGKKNGYSKPDFCMKETRRDATAAASRRNAKNESRPYPMYGRAVLP